MTTQDSIRKRLIRAARAEHITAGETKSISEAVRMYWQAHPEECAGIPATITDRDEDRPRTILDEYERPSCKRCGSPMFWKGSCQTCRGSKKKNVWICKKCNFRRMTKDSLNEAITKLKPKKEKDVD